MSTEQELFDAAVSNEPMQETPAEPAAQPEPSTSAQDRDEQGRFAARAEDEQQPVGEETAPAGTDTKEPPPHRFREISERARAAEARSAELERLLTQHLSQNRQPEAPKAEAAPKPEIWVDPEAWLGENLTPVTQQVASVVETFSRRMAIKEYGAEKVDAAYDALKAACNSGILDGKTVQAELRKSTDPYEDIIGWHAKQAAQSALSTVGNDLEAYNQKVIADFLAKQQGSPATGAPAQAGSPTNVIKIPPNLNRMSSAAPSAPGTEQPLGDAELFNEATTSRRR